MNCNKKIKSFGWKLREGESFAITSLNDMKKTEEKASNTTRKSEMTAQEQAQKNLKKNLQYALKHLHKYQDKFSRPNYLMSIGISCQEGVLCFDYGKDRVANEIKKFSKKESEEQKAAKKKVKK